MNSNHILSIDQFSRTDLENLLQIAQRLEPVAQREFTCHILEGAVLANLFFEPSTRTRISFHTAFVRLGGRVCDVIGMDNSSLSKGESLADTARVISGYADAIVMRHPQIGAVAEFAQNISIPVLNAGDGAGEHPSQALLDYYTIDKEFKRLGKTIDGMRIALVGDLKHGRTIHSLVKLLNRFDSVHFHFISPEELRAPASLISGLSNVSEFDNVAEGLRGVDVIYATRLQRERIIDGEHLSGYSESLRLNRQTILSAAPEAIILHPLPRDGRAGAFDLSTDLDDLPQLAIFRQADNGVTMRMAMFALVLGISDDLESAFARPKWRK